MPAAIVSYFEKLCTGKLGSNGLYRSLAAGTPGKWLKSDKIVSDRNHLHGHGCAPGTP